MGWEGMPGWERARRGGGCVCEGIWHGIVGVEMALVDGIIDGISRWRGNTWCHRIRDVAFLGRNHVYENSATTLTHQHIYQYLVQ